MDFLEFETKQRKKRNKFKKTLQNYKNSYFDTSYY